MTSQKSTQAANVTTAADELNRFARYLEINTRDLRASVANFLVGPSTPSPANASRREAEEGLDEGLFDDDVDIPGGDWVEVTDYATEAKEVCFLRLSNLNFYEYLHLQYWTTQDDSKQIYYRAPTPPPGPIEQTGLAAQRAALQALGLTGTYLEHGLRLAAEDVGWLTRTLQFEDAVHAVQRRFPMLKKLGETAKARRRRERGATGRRSLGRGSSSGGVCLALLLLLLRRGVLPVLPRGCRGRSLRDSGRWRRFEHG